MITVGLTGGIASGKSTVAGLLRRRNVPVIDADRVSRAVVAPGTEGLAEVARAFGPEVLAPDGSLDRSALGRVVVTDVLARRRLEAITHPRIAAAVATELARLADAGEVVSVVEAAVMVEAAWHRAYDAVLLVRCAEVRQVGRLAANRGWTGERARAWLSAQLSSDEREARLRQAQAEGGPRLYTVDNDEDLSALETALDRTWSTLLRDLGVPIKT